MNAMTRRNYRNWHIARNQAGINPGHELDVLLALDRMVVEVSMQLYKVEHRDRSNIRLSNRRLHAAVRKELPRWLKRNNPK